MLHGPLTASNLLVTWRRRHSDARITRQSAGSREGSLINLLDETRWGSKFQQGTEPPLSLCPQHQPGEDERIREEWKRRYPEMVLNHPLFFDSAENIPSQTFSDGALNCTSYMFLCFSSGGIYECLDLQIRHQVKVMHSTFNFPPPPSRRQRTVWEANWEGRADQGCLFICLYMLLEL